MSKKSTYDPENNEKYNTSHYFLDHDSDNTCNIQSTSILILLVLIMFLGSLFATYIFS